ncbi:Ger(x)C family spore germination protein [Syntrophomonas erecta]
MKSLVYVLIPLILIIGCGCQATEVNDTAVAMGLGIDWQEEHFVLTSQLARPTTQEQSGSSEDSQFIVLSEKGKTPTEAARRVMLTLPKIPLWFHASTILIGENLAQEQLPLLVDFLCRNRNIRKNSLVVITRGSTPAQIYELQSPLEPHSAVAIRRTLEIQEKQAGIYMPVTLGDFLSKLSTPGIEPVVPRVEIIPNGNQKMLKIEGTAVFRGPQMVGELNAQESQGYRFLSPKRIRGGLFVIPALDYPERWISIELITSIADAKPVIENNQLKMQIDIIADGNFYEQTSPEQLLSLKKFNQVQRLAQEQMTKQAVQAINRAQTLKADIFGWGRLVESSYPDLWQEIKQDWPETFSQLDYNINIQFELRRTYLTDSSFVFR